MSKTAKLYMLAAVAVVIATIAFRMAGYWAPAWMGASAGGVVLVFALVALYRDALPGAKPTLVAFAFAAVLVWAALIECIGLLVNLPFGSYRYTQLWPPYVALREDILFPLALPVTWAVIGIGSYFAAARVRSAVIRVLATALLATALDLGLESVMTGPALLWYWNEPVTWFGAPWLNFGGWFFSFAVVGAILAALRIKPSSERLGRLVIASAAVMNALVGMAYSKWPALAGLLVIPILFLARSLSPEED